jgi:hypothetical protein
MSIPTSAFAVESANLSSEAAAKKPDEPAPTIATW